MSTLARDAGEQSEQSGIAKLVAAEQAWTARLAEARSRAEAIVAAARNEALREADHADELSGLIAARRQQLTLQQEQEVQLARDELRKRCQRYSAASEETIARLACDITRSMPWFSAGAERP